MSNVVAGADDRSDSARPAQRGSARRDAASRPARAREATPETTLGDVLERDRLRHRADRLSAVVVELRRRTPDGLASGRPAPLPLRQAIAGFERELAAVRRRLEGLG